VIFPLTKDVYVFKRTDYPKIYQERFARLGSHRTRLIRRRLLVPLPDRNY
jgi:hypothetical protein